MADTNYYKILGVNKTASADEIKKSYRKLALEFHPDRNKTPQAEAKFKEISEAYAVLSDPEKRKQYDTFGSTQFHQQYSAQDIFRGTDFNSIFKEFGFGGSSGGGGGFDSIFSQLFGGGGQQQYGYGANNHNSRGRQARGQDIEYSLPITFEESYQGIEKLIRFRVQDGTQREFNLRIPAGVKDGGKLRVAGKGMSSAHGAGDLYVVIQVQNHPRYRRKDNDIEVDLPVRISDAVLGTTTEINTPEGIKKIKIPKGVQSGTKIRLKGLGFPQIGSGASRHERDDDKTRGDFYAVIQIAIPTALDQQHTNLFESLRELGY